MRAATLLATGLGALGLAGTTAHATTVLDAHFDADTEGFAYADDAFGTTEPAYADGAYAPAEGFSGGGLKVTLGGVDALAVVGMSGGWEVTFNVAVAEELELAIRYNLNQSGEYEPAESSQVRAALDGIPLDGLGLGYAVQIVGSGNGSGPISTGWGVYRVSLGVLAVGDHTLTIGGWNSQKTSLDEVSDIVIDDVAVQSPVPFVLSNGDCIMPDADLDAVLAVATGTGDRSVISSIGRGTGVPFQFPRGIAREPDGNLVVVDELLQAVVRVDPANGDRTIVSDAVTGTGPLLITPYDIRTEANGNLVVSDVGLVMILQIDPVTGDRTDISSAATGIGETLVRPSDIRVDGNGDIWVADGDPQTPDTVMLVDRASGDRSFISAPGVVGAGTDFSNLSGITFEANGDVIVTDVPLRAVFRVDPSTGDRTILSDPVTGGGDPIGQPWSVDTEPDGNLLIIDIPEKALTRVSPIDGFRTKVSAMGIGSGPLLEDPRDIYVLSCGPVGGDTDSDGICDPDDPCIFWPNSPDFDDANLDGIPDECQCGDTNEDGQINAIDVGAAALVANNMIGCNECADAGNFPCGHDDAACSPRTTCVDDTDCTGIPGATQCGNPTCLELWETDNNANMNAVDLGRDALAANNNIDMFTMTCPRRPEGTAP